MNTANNTVYVAFPSISICGCTLVVNHSTAVFFLGRAQSMVKLTKLSHLFEISCVVTLTVIGDSFGWPFDNPAIPFEEVAFDFSEL